MVRSTYKTPKDGQDKSLLLLYVNSSMERQTIVLTISLIVAISTVLLTVNLISFNHKTEAQQTASNHVLVGGGNNTNAFIGYSSQQIQIEAGSSVVWSVPPNAPIEPHTVTFVINNNTMATPDRSLLFQVLQSLCLYPLTLIANQT